MRGSASPSRACTHSALGSLVNQRRTGVFRTPLHSLCVCLAPQFYAVSPYLEERPEYPEEDGSAPLFAANMAYLLNNEDGARFFFVKGAFTSSKF